MNDLVIIQTTQGICRYLVQVFGEAEAQRRGVAIGYDHRAAGTLNSKRFAELTAAVCVHAGFKVYLYEGFVATPLVPFCIERKAVRGGVMVTRRSKPRPTTATRSTGQRLADHPAARRGHRRQHPREPCALADVR
ncbi:hypothetical protein PINS_up022855 [Pythium insidiosum]|nr:hypothetical protein PINS_up022855 [Pythium insidiosum]